MDKPYLIAHKCRGEPAFDIAEQMPCPECNAHGCFECDNLGYWWMMHGARAYPYWSFSLDDIADKFDPFVGFAVPPMPEGHPDHFHANDRKAQPKGPSLLDRLGLRKHVEPIRRRV